MNLRGQLLLLSPLGPSSRPIKLIGPNHTDCFRVRKSPLNTTVVKDENAAVIAIFTAGAVTAVEGEIHPLCTCEKVFPPAGLGPVKLAPAAGGCELLECLPPAV